MLIYLLSYLSKCTSTSRTFCLQHIRAIALHGVSKPQSGRLYSIYCSATLILGPYIKWVLLTLKKKIRNAALELDDSILITKLSCGNLMAQEAKYHLSCLTSFYYKAESLQKKIKTDSKLSQANAIALAEIVALIEEAHSVSDTSVPVFKLSDLVKMYSARVNHNEQSFSPRINSSHLKKRILARVPYWEAHRQGKEIFLVHKKDIGNIIKGSSSYDVEGMYLTNAAKIVRREVQRLQGLFINMKIFIRWILQKQQVVIMNKPKVSK